MDWSKIRPIWSLCLERTFLPSLETQKMSPLNFFSHYRIKFQSRHFFSLCLRNVPGRPSQSKKSRVRLETTSGQLFTTLHPRVARFFLTQQTKAGKNVPKWPQHIPNGHVHNIPNVCKIFRMATKYAKLVYSKALKTIFCLKIYYLAALLPPATVYVKV
jgi:hypothetical protein